VFLADSDDNFSLIHKNKKLEPVHAKIRRGREKVQDKDAAANYDEEATLHGAFVLPLRCLRVAVVRRNFASSFHVEERSSHIPQ
jgi:hypothetical protein